MRQLLFFVILSFYGLVTFAESKINVRINDVAALQRGAKIYMNYCAGCHSLKYLRYNRMAFDLGLTNNVGQVDQDLLMSNLVFTMAKPQDPIDIALPLVDARQWFGRLPPDLSLIVRQRGANWLYVFLKSFYKDQSRPFGSNNAVFADVAMPNVLISLQGEQGLSLKTSQMPMLYPLCQGQLSAPEFDRLVQDLVDFLAYVGEPNQSARYHIGFMVIIFLLLLLGLSFGLYREIWKNQNIKY